MTGAVECPSCGAPAGVLPADPRAPIACGFCGTSYERVTAEKALSSLRADVAAWLQKTAGVAAGAGGASVDAATRTFLFNDRILPGLRREVRRAIDEKVGDVLGSAIVVPRLLFELSGFRGEDSVLLSMRNAILGLRSLRVRIESEEVSAFATTAADRMALDALRDDLDRALFASNAACALAGSFREGAMLARKNLEVLGRDPPGALLATVDPGAAMLASAMHDRCQTLNRALDAVLSTPPDGEALKQSAARLEDLSHTLLTHESRSLRSALASTGIVRDATALRVLAAVASGIERAQLPLAETLDAMQLFAPGLSEVTRHKDVAYLVHGWATAVAAKASGGGLPAIGDTSWMAGAIEQARGRDERCGRVEAMLCPYWAFSVRHSKAEGVFFVSGRQHEGLALVPASAHSNGTLLLVSGDPLAAEVQRAGAHSQPVELPLDLARIGPDMARSFARSVLRSRDLRNVTLGDPTFLYLPVAMTELIGPRGSRWMAVGLRGATPHDPASSLARAQTLAEVVRRARAAASAQRG